AGYEMIWLLEFRRVLFRSSTTISGRIGAQVNDSPGELAPIRPEIVVLDFKFPNRILGRKNERQVDVADIERLAVQIFRALVRKEIGRASCRDMRSMTALIE